MNAVQLNRLTLGQAENYYAEGRISQVEYEAYRHAFAALSPHPAISEGVVRGWESDRMHADVRPLFDEIMALHVG